MYKVIIIDDEFFSRESLSKSALWSKYGFSVCACAECGITGYEEIKKHMPHLVILDINMPNMNGLELVAKLRSENNELEVIILSGYSEFEYAKQCIKYNVSSYLLKPLDDDELVLELKKIRIKLDDKYKGFEEKNSVTETVVNIKKYISQNYNDPTLTIEDICSYLGYNYHYVCKLFKQQSGDNLGKYIFTIRMKNAKMLIENGENKIDYISSKVGYSDSLYFGKCFKKHFGCTPSKYIKGYKIDNG